MRTRVVGWDVRQRRNRAVTCGAVFAILITGAGTARGQTAQSFEDLQARRLVKLGDTVTVEDASGRKVRGKVDALDDGSVTLKTKSAGGLSEQVFAESDVTRIRRGTRALAKSAIIGAGVALAVTASGAAAYGANEGGGLCGACLVQWSACTVPVGVGVGALIGFTIDRATARTIFDRRNRSSAVSVAPVLGPGTVAGVASIRF